MRVPKMNPRSRENPAHSGPARALRKLAVSGSHLCLFAWLASALACRDGSASRPPAVRLPSQPEIILVTIDTLRADALGSSGNTRVRTPILDRLAREGWRFRNAHAHNVVTLPSHVNILTGLLPYQHGVRDNSGFRLDAGTVTLASRLKTLGYATGAFVGAFPLDSRFGLSRGFDVYDDGYPKGKTSLDFEMPERPAREVVAAARKWWVENAGSPRFLWVHLYDCHAPYRPPPPFDEQYDDDPYLGEVSAVDAALSPLIEPVLDGGPGPHTPLVIVTADHGESRGEHGELTHGLFAYEATLHIPLLAWMGGVLRPNVRSDPVRHVDIAPTILAAVRLPKPAEWTGSSLLGPREADSPAFSYFEAYSAAYNRGWAPLRGMIGSGKKYIDLPVPELYDLEKDPAESVNLADREGEALRALARAMPADSAILRGRGTSASNEEVKRLASLGYLSGAVPVQARYGPDTDPKALIGVDRQLHESVDLHERGETERAIAVARQIVASHPRMGVAYQNLAFLLRQTGASRSVLEVYAEALRHGVMNEEIAWHFGLALSEAGRGMEAVQVLKPYAHSGDPDTLNALGIAYADAGNLARSVDALQQALRADPRNVEAYENLGIVSLREKNRIEARDLFRKALALEARLPRAWNGLGVALAGLGDERGAMECWTRAATLDPSLYDALFNLGSTAAKIGLTAEARDALERFVATAPQPQHRADIERARRLLATLKTAS